MLELRWFLQDARMSALARDNAISASTAYDDRDEGITVLAVRRPGLHGALLAAKAAGHTHVILDGTLIYTDRIHTPGPTTGVDLWWSGNTSTTAGTSRSCPHPTGGRCGPRTCIRAASTTRRRTRRSRSAAPDQGLDRRRRRGPGGPGLRR